MEYRGCVGTAHYSEEDECYWGKLLNVGKDLVMYEGETWEQFKVCFEETIDDYISWLEEVNNG